LKNVTLTPSLAEYELSNSVPCGILSTNSLKFLPPLMLSSFTAPLAIEIHFSGTNV